MNKPPSCTLYSDRNDYYYYIAACIISGLLICREKDEQYRSRYAQMQLWDKLAMQARMHHRERCAVAISKSLSA